MRCTRESSSRSREVLREIALERARQLAPLGANRAVYGGQKERIYGENAAINGPHGAAHMLRHSSEFH